MNNKDIALHFIHEGIGAQNMEAFNHFHKEARFWQNGKVLETSGYHSIAEMADLAARVMGKFPDGLEFNILTVTGEENRVLVEAESNAVLADGKQYNNQYVFAFYFNGFGKIIEFREYWDTMYGFETMFGGVERL